MSITLIRVVNQQAINRSILIDKLDDGQANTEGYAHLPKQKVYVSYWNNKKDAGGNLIDPSVKGYIDFVPSDRVLLSADRGTLHGLASAWNVHGFVSSGLISMFAFDSALTATPVVTSVSHLGTDTTITGTTFLSVTPDVTYAIFTNPSGTTQKIPSSAFSGFTTTQIVVPNAAVTIGTPDEGWTVTIQANCKTSNAQPIGDVAVITTAVLGPTGNVTLTGTHFASTLPNLSSVVITGTGAVTLTRAAIIAAPGGVFTDTSVVIPAALVPGVAEATTSAAVVAESFTSAAVALIVTPVLTTAQIDAPGAGDLTLTGTSFLSTAPATSSVIITGTGAVTLTRAAILAAGGVAAFTETSVVIPAALVPGIAATTSSAQVQADGLLSSVVVVTV